MIAVLGHVDKFKNATVPFGFGKSMELVPVSGCLEIVIDHTDKPDGFLIYALLCGLGWIIQRPQRTCSSVHVEPASTHSVSRLLALSVSFLDDTVGSSVSFIYKMSCLHPQHKLVWVGEALFVGCLAGP